MRTGFNATTFVWDLQAGVQDGSQPEHRFAALIATHQLRGLVMAAGLLYTEAEIVTDNGKVRLMLNVNLTETMQVLYLFAAYFEKQVAEMVARGSSLSFAEKPYLCVLSSVAGDRGRGKNAAYGASKAGLSAFLEGLRARLFSFGISVISVKPGPVRTPMTAQYQGPTLLLAEPEKVARDIFNGIRARKNVVYTPGYWRFVMAIIKHLPIFLLNRLKA